MSVDEIEERRRRSREEWEAAAAGWERRQEQMRDFGAPVSRWLVDAARLQPGHRVLEVAAGIGETGFLAAELIAPGGTLVSTDQAEGMVEAARRRAEALGLDNVEFKVVDGEWLDFPVASFDAVLSRFGYMLMADPQAALGEARRVLRPGGRIALAVWDAPQHNPWMLVPMGLLLERGVVQPPDPAQPGPFSLGDPDRLRSMLEEAGFSHVEVEPIDVVQRQPSFDAWLESILDLSRAFHDAFMGMAQAQAQEIREALRERFAPFTAADGSVALPGRTLGASADG